MNNIFNSFNFLEFIFSFFSILLGDFYFNLNIVEISYYNCLDYIDSNYLETHILHKRPRDYIINNDYPFKDKCRRKIHWIFLEKFDSNYNNYRDFKVTWNTDDKFFIELKSKILEEKQKIIQEITNKYIEQKRHFIIQKKTFLWFLNRRNG